MPIRHDLAPRVTYGRDDFHVVRGRADTPPTTFDLRSYFDPLIQGRKRLLLFALLGLLLGVGYSQLVQPTYRSDALLQVSNEATGMEAALGRVGALLGGDTAVTSELEILRSRAVLGATVDNMRLDIAAAPKHFPVIGEAISRRHADEQPAAAWFGLDRYAWGGETIAVEEFEVPAALQGKAFTLVKQDQARFRVYDPDGGFVAEGAIGERVEASLNDRPLALRVTALEARPGTQFSLQRLPRQAAISSLNENLYVSERGRQSSLIGVTFESDDPERSALILSEIIDTYLQQNARYGAADTENMLALLEQELPNLRNQVQTAEAALSAFQSERGTVNMSSETQLALERAVEAESRLIAIQQRREELSRELMPEHPRMRALAAQEEAVRQELEQTDQRTRALPDAQQELLRLTRDVEVATELYTTLLSNAEALKIASAASTSNIRVIDAPAVPNAAANSQGPLIVGAMLAAGLLLGMFTILVPRLLGWGGDPRVVEEKLGLPVLASLPHSAEQASASRRQHGSRVLALRRPDDPSVAALRDLRTALHLGLYEARNNILLVASAESGAGRAFVAVNLAALLVQAGKKVLVVDADMSGRPVSKLLAHAQGPGLAELLSAQCEPGEAIRSVSPAGLFIMASGSAGSMPSELLLNGRLGPVLNRCGRDFDHVLVVAAPVLSAADALVAGRIAGGALLVSGAASKSVSATDSARRKLQRAGVEVQGVVLNQAKPSRRSEAPRGSASAAGHATGVGSKRGKAA